MSFRNTGVLHVPLLGAPKARRPATLFSKASRATLQGIIARARRRVQETRARRVQTRRRHGARKLRKIKRCASARPRSAGQRTSPRNVLSPTLQEAFQDGDLALVFKLAVAQGLPTACFKAFQRAMADAERRTFVAQRQELGAAAPVDEELIRVEQVVASLLDDDGVHELEHLICLCTKVVDPDDPSKDESYHFQLALPLWSCGTRAMAVVLALTTCAHKGGSLLAGSTLLCLWGVQ